MKIIKQKFYWLLLLAFSSTACQDELFTEIAISVPENLDFVAEIADDDTGTVTLTPSADGAAYFEVDYGDGSGTTERIQPGKSGEHVYPEGDYTVSVTAYGLGGQSINFSKDIMVRFTPPENLVLNISVDPVQTNVITVAPTADNAMNFEVYFGDLENEEPTILGTSETVMHTYAESGTYTVRVVAKSASSTTIEASQEVEIVKPTVSLSLPIDFENPDIAYSFVEFGGAALAVVDNPDASDGNTSAKVGQLVKTDGAEVWAGGFLQLPEAIDFSGGTEVSLKVWSPKEGVVVRFKIENENDAGLFFEADATTTLSNTWETLNFDFSGVDVGQGYHKVVVFFDFGNRGDGSEYYFDDIRIGGVAGPSLALPVDFEDAALDYAFVNFGGAGTSVIDNPDASGINTSGKVANLNKGNGAEVWAGSFLQLDQAIDFMNNDLLRLDVWSPKEGITVKVKVENSGNPDINFEVDRLTSTPNSWETLEYDFSEIDVSQDYDRVVVFFDFGNPGDGSDYFFDNIRVVSSIQETSLALPVDFEDPFLSYTFTDFGGAGAGVIDNPDASGINTSGKVANLNKGNGAEVWAGSFLQLDQAIDFMNNDLLRLDVWSPKEGITVKIKVENSGNPDINFEVDRLTSTTNSWETLEYDFSGIDASQDYDRVVVFFDFGNPGDGSDYFFDNIRAVSSNQPSILRLPLDLENPDLNYAFIGFGNVEVEVVDNPLMNANNNSTKVGQLTKPNGAETWGGTVLELDEPLDFSKGTTIEMNAVSPKPGVTVLFKIENASDPGVFHEVSTSTSVVDDWETLSFDFSGADQSKSYSKVVVFFDFGVNGDDSVYLFDDITLK